MGRLAPLLVPSAATLIALLLGLYQIGSRSITLDESASVYVAEADPARFLEMITHSKLNMSLYFMALRPWSVLGSGEGIVRVLGVVFAAASIPFLYLSVRQLIDEWIAGLAAFALALNAFFVEWAQQARGYGLAMLLASAATWLLTRLIAEPAAWWWLAYGLVAGLGVYAHVFVGFVVVAHYAAVLLCWRQRAVLIAALRAAVVVGMVTAPMLLAIALGNASALDWIGSLTWDGLRVTLRNLSGGGLAFWLYGAGMVASLVVLAVWWRRADRRAPGLVLLLCWALLPFVLSVLVSLVKPVLVPRYLLISLPAISTCVVIGVVGLLRPRWAVVAAGGAVLVITALSLPAYYGGKEQVDYRALTQVLARESVPGDAVTWWSGFHSRPSVYYARRLGLTDLPPPILTRMRWEGNPYEPGEVATWPDDCLPAGIWLVGAPRILPADPPEGRRSEIVALLQDYERVPPTRRFGALRLQLFELRPSASLPACPA